MRRPFYLFSLLLIMPAWLAFPLADAAFVESTSTSVPPATDDSYGATATDVDGVNGLDLVVAIRGKNKLLINDGTGVFTDRSTQLPSMDETTLAVAAGDVDGINGPDLFLANSTQNRLLINDGSGSFADETAGRLPPDVSYSMDVLLRDVDNDNDLDVFVATRNGQNRLLINDGRGNFDDQSLTRLPQGIHASHAIVLDDFDGDGTPDAFVVNHGQQNRFLRNNGFGVFTDDTAFALPPIKAGSNDAVSLDVDGDGDRDLAIADDVAGVRLLNNDGTGSFRVAARGSMPMLAEHATRVVAGDVDFDGSTDLVVGNAGQDRVLLNDSNGVFADATGAQLPTDGTRTFGVTLLDGDGDGDLDFFAATPQGQDRYYENDITFVRSLLDISPDYIEQIVAVPIDVPEFDEDGADGGISFALGLFAF